MRRASVIGALALGATGLAPAGGATGHGLEPLPCPPAGGRLVAGNNEVRVYRPSQPASAAPPVVACLVGRRIRMTLLAARPLHIRSVSEFPGSLEKLALAGPIVAYLVEKRTGVDTSSSSLIVANIATRRILRSASVGYSVDAGFVAGENVTSLVVTSGGSVAWIEERHRGPRRSPMTMSVYAAPPTGSPILLDEGPSIAAESLTLSRDTIGWVDGTVRRSAPMP